VTEDVLISRSIQLSLVYSRYNKAERLQSDMERLHRGQIKMATVLQRESGKK